MDDEIIEVPDEECSGTCSECGARCLDPETDGVGITRGGEPICSDCAASEGE